MDQPAAEDPEQEYSRVLTIAKEALKYIGVFQTPPTPSIYEVWYRYVEGTDQDLHEQLEHAVTVRKSVSKELLEYCHQKKIVAVSGSQGLEAVSDKLAHELSSLTTLLSDQLKASGEIEQGVQSTRASIKDQIATPEMFRACIEQLLASNEAMREQLTSTRAQMEQSRSQIGKLKVNLQESQKTLLIDSLTGIGNRRFCHSAIKHTIMQRDKANSPAYMILVDLDKLRAVNDSCGYTVGNDLLKHTSQVLRHSLPNASLSRLEGDDFVIIQLQESHAEVTRHAMSICEQIAGMTFVANRTGERLKKITVSIGCAVLRKSDDERSWFDRAQKLLASAKKSGGNQVMVESSF